MSGITLGDKELERLLVVNQVKERIITQAEAAERLGLSIRQIRRVLKRIASEGAEGIKSRPKGGNRAFGDEFKRQVLACVTTHYHDFGPTFASEKLQSRDNLRVNRETLRQWMIEAELWKGRTRKKARIHQSRERRPRFGELVQIDGSHHAWFETRGSKCCLLVFIDDATGHILGLHFSKGETTMGYLKLIQHHLENYGRPIAYYSDKHSVFKTTRTQNTDGYLQDTQVHRALRELRIELILANSSQAKGRVERVNLTLQDRLIKEMRLRGISSIEEANEYAPEFMIDYNKKFAILPADSEDAHRPVVQGKEKLRRILSIQSQRKLTKNLEFSMGGKIYQIQTKTTGYRLRYKTVNICKHIDDSMEVLCDGMPLEYTVLLSIPRAREADVKEINCVIDELVWAHKKAA